MTDLMAESQELEDRRGRSGTAIVTGAGGGLGHAIAVRLAQDGYAVAAIDVDQEAGDATAELVRQAGGAATSYALDLRDAEAIGRCIERVESEVGPVTALVNNAAVFPSGPFLDASVDE